MIKRRQALRYGIDYLGRGRDEEQACEVVEIGIGKEGQLEHMDERKDRQQV